MDLTSAGEYYLKQMVSVLNKQKTITKKKLPLINKWQTLLGLSDWVILCEPISEEQVVDEMEQNTNGHEFVGIQIDFSNKIGTIYHTRKLNGNDIFYMSYFMFVSILERRKKLIFGQIFFNVSQTFISILDSTNSVSYYWQLLILLHYNFIKLPNYISFKNKLKVH